MLSLSTLSILAPCLPIFQLSKSVLALRPAPSNQIQYAMQAKEIIGGYSLDVVLTGTRNLELFHSESKP